jgi:hypothetical protein
MKLSEFIEKVQLELPHLSNKIKDKVIQEEYGFVCKIGRYVVEFDSYAENWLFCFDGLTGTEKTLLRAIHKVNSYFVFDVLSRRTRKIKR